MLVHPFPCYSMIFTDRAHAIHSFPRYSIQFLSSPLAPVNLIPPPHVPWTNLSCLPTHLVPSSHPSCPTRLTWPWRWYWEYFFSLLSEVTLNSSPWGRGGMGWVGRGWGALGLGRLGWTHAYIYIYIYGYALLNLV